MCVFNTCPNVGKCATNQKTLMHAQKSLTNSRTSYVHLVGRVKFPYNKLISFRPSIAHPEGFTFKVKILSLLHGRSWDNEVSRRVQTCQLRQFLTVSLHKNRRSSSTPTNLANLTRFDQTGWAHGMRRSTFRKKVTTVCSMKSLIFSRVKYQLICKSCLPGTDI